MAEPIVVCLKRSQVTDVPLRLGEGARGVRADETLIHANPTDMGALRWALSLAEQMGTQTAVEVYAVSVGPPGWDESLRAALAAGAVKAVRVWNPSWGGEEWMEQADASADRTAFLARAAAEGIEPWKPALILTGDASADTGHGCFGAFLAHALGIGFAHRAAQVVPLDGQWRVRCKLDRGYAQEMVISRPAVITVGALPPLPPAPLPAWLRSRTAEIPCVVSALQPPPASATTLRAPVPRVKRYPALSPEFSAQERIGALVDQPLVGGGTVLQAEEGIAAQVEAIIQVLREREYIG
ncbi:MAG: hypothetical protein IID61_02825 [SAR324 cluster bacterium]|nr:hypothetical protein [SAR324 cluster bacterium]